jgi:hypothetical protein
MRRNKPVAAGVAIGVAMLVAMAYCALTIAGFSPIQAASGFLTQGFNTIELIPQTAQVIAEGDSITFAGTLQPITALTNVTTSNTGVLPPSTIIGYPQLFLKNNSTCTITVKDGGKVQQGGDVAIGPKGMMGYQWDGSEWICNADRHAAQ